MNVYFFWKIVHTVKCLFELSAPCSISTNRQLISIDRVYDVSAAMNWKCTHKITMWTMTAKIYVRKTVVIDCSAIVVLVHFVVIVTVHFIFQCLILLTGTETAFSTRSHRIEILQKNQTLVWRNCCTQTTLNRIFFSFVLHVCCRHFHCTFWILSIQNAQR